MDGSGNAAQSSKASSLFQALKDSSSKNGVSPAGAQGHNHLQPKAKGESSKPNAKGSGKGRKGKRFSSNGAPKPM